MIHLSSEFCTKLRERRREAGLTQSALAHEVGCKQSALSMFEQGDGTKLNSEVVNKLAQKFGLDVESCLLKSQGEITCIQLPSAARQGATGYCPNLNCPSNHRYQVDDQVLYRPDRAAADPVGGMYCAVCGELLERRCPNCGAEVHDGAICSFCGAPYIAV